MEQVTSNRQRQVGTSGPKQQRSWDAAKGGGRGASKRHAGYKEIDNEL